jgi:hypothetical protein
MASTEAGVEAAGVGAIEVGTGEVIEVTAHTRVDGVFCYFL